MKLKVLGLGLSLGILSGLAVFVMTLLALYANYGLGWFALTADVYPYYELSLVGAFIGLAFGFIDGFIGGVLIAFLYNLFSGGCCSKEECCKE